MCCTPGCTRLTDFAHNLFPKTSANWVSLPDGTEVGNLVPLCYKHHQQVTDNQVHITYENDKFLWEGEPLSWQPPFKNRPIPEPVADIRVGSDGIERPVCPGCGRLLPRIKIDTPVEGKKPRKTWAVGVPDTKQEDGADTLDALLEAAREEMDKAGLNWGDGHKVKFHVLATALGLFVSHAGQILSDG